MHPKHRRLAGDWAISMAAYLAVRLGYISIAVLFFDELPYDVYSIPGWWLHRHGVTVGYVFIITFELAFLVVLATTYQIMADDLMRDDRRWMAGVAPFAFGCLLWLLHSCWTMWQIYAGEPVWFY